MVRIFDPARESAPWICIRQLESSDTTVLAPVCWMASILVRAMAPESSGNFTENVPPNPQHSSAGSISRSSRPRTFASSRRGARSDVQLAKPVAAVVERDDVFEARAHVFHLRDFGEEGRELVHALRQRVDARQRFGLFVEQIGEMVADHRSARARGNHDVFAGFERLQKVPRHGARFVAIAAVEGGLSAAGLVFGEIDRVAEAFQHFHHGHAGGGK